MKTYEIKTLDDFRRIPADRRAACFKEFEYALSLADFAEGEGVEIQMNHMMWIDDGDVEIALNVGDETLNLSVTEQPCTQQS